MQDKILIDITPLGFIGFSFSNKTLIYHLIFLKK